jgi:hypothetical protein
MLVVTVEMLVECVAMPRPSRVCKYVMGDPENLKMVKSVLEKLKSEAQTKYGWAGGIPPEDLPQQYEKAKAEAAKAKEAVASSKNTIKTTQASYDAAVIEKNSAEAQVQSATNLANSYWSQVHAINLSLWNFPAQDQASLRSYQNNPQMSHGRWWSQPCAEVHSPDLKRQECEQALQNKISAWDRYYNANRSLGHQQTELNGKKQALEALRLKLDEEKKALQILETKEASANKLLLVSEEKLQAQAAQADPSMLFVVMSSIQDNALPSRAAEVSARSFATTTTGYDTERFEKIKEQAAKDVFDLDNEWIYVN